MASPVSGVPIGRTQSPQPMTGRGFTTILCDGTFRPGPSSLGSPLALVRSRSVRAVTSWREPRLILTASSQAGGSSQQHASAKKVNLNRLQQQQQCCVSSTEYNLESAGAGRPAASPVMGQQFRLQFIQFIWQEYIPNLLNAFFIITDIW